MDIVRRFLAKASEKVQLIWLPLFDVVVGNSLIFEAFNYGRLLFQDFEGLGVVAEDERTGIKFFVLIPLAKVRLNEETTAERGHVTGDRRENVRPAEDSLKSLHVFDPHPVDVVGMV